jgi:DNA-binding NtrC family response regulator
MAHAYILVVDDEPDIRRLLKEILEDEGYEVVTAENAAEARQLRRARRPDLILLDIWMPDVDGITLLKEWNEGETTHVPVIMMSGHGTVETAVEATRLGAFDYIEKPLSLAKLLLSVQHALESYNLLRENRGLRRQLQPINEPVGRSTIMQQLRERARRIAQHDTPVLIRGEPGCGKGVFARFIHQSSSRRDGPFVDVGVASLLGDNPAVELFGSEEGDKVHYGLLEQASGGSLFLDDIADMDPIVQARLLGSLENGTFQRMGGSVAVPVNVRIITATRHALEQRVQNGSLRSDLYYLLNVAPLAIPPLREHGEDVPDLLNYYLDYFVSQDKLPYRTFSTAAQNRLRQYRWPGNVRELKNLVQRLLISGSISRIELDEVESVLGSHREIIATPPAAEAQLPFDLPLREAREQFERQYFEALLRRHEGSVNKVAQHAGVERTHLYRKLRLLGIDPRELKGN